MNRAFSRRCLGEVEDRAAVIALCDSFAGLGGDEGGVDDLEVAGAARLTCTTGEPISASSKNSSATPALKPLPFTPE